MTSSKAHSKDSGSDVSGRDDSYADDLFVLAERIVASAEGDEQIEVVLGRGASTTVRVYRGEVESLTSADGSGAGVRVIRDGRVGFAHCGTIDENVLAETLADARDNLRFAEPDEHNVLARPDGVAAVPQDTWSPQVLALPTDSKIAFALDLEDRVLNGDPRIVNARSTIFSDGWGESVIVSTAGIRVAERSSSVSMGTQPLSESDGETQIGFGHGVWADPADIDVAKVAAEAVERAVRLLGASKPASSRMPIVLEPRLAMTLMGIVSGMLSGDTVSRGRSPFADRLGELVASPLLTLIDDPTRSASLGAAEYDGEGLACRPNPLIVDGVIDRFLYDTYTAHRVGTTSTASAVRGTRSMPGVGAQLLVMGSPESSDASAKGSTDGTTDSVDVDARNTELRDHMIGQVGSGLYVNSFAGLHSGVNAVSGDFSVGADGLMLRNGELAEPVRELTVASTIQRLLQNIVTVGSDFEWLASGDGAVSLVIDDVSISGTN